MEADDESQLEATSRAFVRLAPALPATLALAAGLGLRLWMLKQYFQVNGDALIYGAVAKNLLLHGRYALGSTTSSLSPTLIRLPGYPLLMALCFRIFGMENYASLAWVQIALSLAGCLLLADFVRRIASKGAARWTLWLAALCPFTAIYDIVPLTESLTLFALVLALWSVAVFHSRPGWGPALSFTFAVSFAALLRPDGALMGVALAPALVSVIWEKREASGTEVPAHQPRFGRLVRMAVVCLLLALMPFAAWSWRNWRVFCVFEPLAPRLATDPGEYSHPGWERWVKSWCLDFVSTFDIYWSVPGDPLDMSQLPGRAFDSPAQYAETAAVADRYNVRDQAQEIYPDVDALFGKLADERIAAHPMRYYVWLPLGRLADMSLRPRVDNLFDDLDWWVYSDHPAKTLLSWAYAVLNALLLLLGFAGVCLRPRFWRPMAVYLLLRSALLLTVEAPETRYTLEFFPILFALSGVALYRSMNWVWLSVLKVKASAGRG